MENNVGRPPKNPENRLSYPVRAMVTQGVVTALQKAEEIHGLDGDHHKQGKVSSDILRFYIVEGLRKDGLLDADDPSWVSLKEAGLV